LINAFWYETQRERMNMDLRALRFTAAADGVEPARSDLNDELIRSFAKDRLQFPPAAYVILNNDLPSLRRFEGLLVDRGRKHEAKPLAKLLLGHSKIPFIKGSYESSGQLVRSVRTLLENAFARTTTISIIGTSEKILDELWRAGSAAVDKRLAWAHGCFTSRGQEALSSQRLLQLLPPRDSGGLLFRRL
jgi:hypothetical protein